MLNKICKLYYAFPNFDFLGLFGKGLNRGLGMLSKRLLDGTVAKKMLSTQRKAGLGINVESRDRQYILSLTSFPDRIQDVWICVESLLRQRFKPDKIILWLAKEQFPEREIPGTLKVLEERGLEVRFCEEDLLAHKKYFYSLENYPNAIIITADDDIYYDDFFIENLFLLHKKYPHYIVTNRAHKMRFHSDNKVKRYRKWKHNITEEKPSHLLLATNGGGTLYPPNSLDLEVLNTKVFKKICFLADDIWLKCMALKKGTKIVTNAAYNKDPITIGRSQIEKLVSKNVMAGGNDEQLQEVCAYYNIDLTEYIEK